MNPPRILVVDDEPDLLALYSVMLDQEGYQVLQAATATECLQIVKDELPDIVLLDVILPDLDGIEVCKRIKADEATARILVIHISGTLISADNAAEALEAGADGYLTKPIEPRALLAHVNALLRWKQAEQALARSEEQFRAAFDNALDAMLIADDQAKFVDANPAACALFGVPRDELLKRSLSDFLAPAERRPTERAWETFIADGERRGDTRLHRPDGTTRELEYRAKASFLPHRHLSVLRDVTERKQAAEELRAANDELEKRVEQRTAELVAINTLLQEEIAERNRAEQALRDAEKKYRGIFENALEGIFQSTPNGKFISANPSMARIFGYESAAELMACRTEIGSQHYVEPNRRAEFKELIATDNIVQNFELQCYRKDGSKIWTSENVRAVFDASGALLYYEGIVEDITERKQHQEELRRSEEQYRELVENINDILYATDEQGVITYITPAIEYWAGLSPDEIIGHAFAEFIHPEDLPSLVENFQQSASNHARPSEFRIFDKSGKIHWFRKSSRPVFQGDRFTGTRGLLTDITERKQAYGALQASEERLRLLIGGVKDYAIFMLDCDGCVVSWNEGAKLVKGYEAEEIIGKHFSCFFPGEDLKDGKPEQELKAATVAGRCEDEGWRIRKDGSLFYASVVITALRDEEGNLRGFSKVTRDITERRQAQEALRATNRTLGTLIQASPLAIVGLDVSGKVTMWNPAARLIFGWTEEEALGRPLPFVPEDKQEEHRALHRKVLQGDLPAVVEIRRQRKDGSLVDISLSTAALRDDKGIVSGVVGIMADITARKHVEEERALLLGRLVTAQEEEQRRLSRELHDQMGQSIAALLLGLKALDDSAQFKSAEINRLHQLQDLTNQLAHVVHNLASSLRPTALDDLGLDTALSNQVEEWSERTGIRADLHCNGLIQQRLSPQIETTVYRVVQEALTNVLKHANAQNVSIIVEHRGNRVRAIVEDDGAGFDVEAMIEKPLSERRLGLMGMKERASLVGGTLDIESRPGAGTTVILYIPISLPQLGDPLEETTHLVGR